MPRKGNAQPDLATYLDEIRHRHRLGRKILSKMQMSIEAGLSTNAVQQIVSGRTGASPATLKALCDRWGEPEDYRELLKLAGHPLPDDGWDELVEVFDDLSPDNRERVRKYAAKLVDEQPNDGGIQALAPSPVAA